MISLPSRRGIAIYCGVRCITVLSSSEPTSLFIIYRWIQACIDIPYWPVTETPVQRIGRFETLKNQPCPEISPPGKWAIPGSTDLKLSVLKFIFNIHLRDRQAVGFSVGYCGVPLHVSTKHVSSLCGVYTSPRRSLVPLFPVPIVLTMYTNSTASPPSSYGLPPTAGDTADRHRIPC
jgi:hypothetical protein